MPGAPARANGPAATAPTMPDALNAVSWTLRDSRNQEPLMSMTVSHCAARQRTMARGEENALTCLRRANGRVGRNANAMLSTAMRKPRMLFEIRMTMRAMRATGRGRIGRCWLLGRFVCSREHAASGLCQRSDHQN